MIENVFPKDSQTIFKRKKGHSSKEIMTTSEHTQLAAEVTPDYQKLNRVFEFVAFSGHVARLTLKPHEDKVILWYGDSRITWDINDYLIEHHFYTKDDDENEPYNDCRICFYNKTRISYFFSLKITQHAFYFLADQDVLKDKIQVSDYDISDK